MFGVRARWAPAEPKKDAAAAEQELACAEPSADPLAQVVQGKPQR